MRLLLPGVIDDIPCNFLNEMENVLSYVDANGDLDINHFSTHYARMFAADVKECFDLFKSYRTIFHHINKGVNDVRKQLKMYITRERDRRKSNSKKRAFVPPAIASVVSGGIQECLYNAYSSNEGTSKRSKKENQSIPIEATDQTIECATVTSSSLETPSMAEVSLTDHPPSTATPSSRSRRPNKETVIINNVSDTDSTDVDYKEPIQRRVTKSDAEKTKQKMEMMRKKKKEKKEKSVYCVFYKQHTQRHVKKEERSDSNSLLD